MKRLKKIVSFIGVISILMYCKGNDGNGAEKIEKHEIVKTSPKNIESIVKTLCSCEPLSVFEEIYNDKIFYLTLEKKEDEDGFERSLVMLNVAEKIGNRWVKIKNEEIYSEEYVIILKGEDVLELEENEKNIKIPTKVHINKKAYYYVPLEIGHMGTANNGFHNNVFMFYNIDETEDVILIDYKMLYGEEGEYSIISKNAKNKSIGSYKEYIAEVNNFIDILYGNDFDIDSPQNFIKKWNIENKYLYDSRIVNVVEYDTSAFFDEWVYKDKSNVKENDRYKVLAGFKSPILAYDKRRNKTMVLFIPDGFPNGCCWGDRSFEIKSFKNNIITAESREGEEIEIDIVKRKLL